MDSNKVTFGLFTVLVIVGLAWVGREKFMGRQNEAPPAPAVSVSETPSAPKSAFQGIEGEKREISSGGVSFDVSILDDGKARFFNTRLSNGNDVYYFLVKSPDGKLRAAANGCQVCGRALQGFRQEGDHVVCNTCGNRYHLNQVASEKGGCNPAPISASLAVNASRVTLSESDLARVQEHFFP